MTALLPDGFPAFFEALWGHAPFPWQARLAAQVCREGRWPEVIDAPTGVGKTATIDIAVFHLALEAGCRSDRRAPVRILFVVDRRLVVDEAAQRARRMAEELASASTGILKEVADALRRLAADDGAAPPLAVARLRGGMPRETDWARSPSQPTIVLSTVDQVGSRLLFRGYGVSRSMWPVHAGLVGADALWLLDEAHLSEPFAQTLSAVRCLRGRPAGAAPFMAVRLSATPAHAVAVARFGLDEEDRAHPIVARRLSAAKATELRKAGAEPADDFVQAALELAGRVAPAPATKTRGKRSPGQEPPSVPAGPPACVVAVVVNRIALARAVFEGLQASLAGGNGALAGADVVLLIGRSRPLDRERIIGAFWDRIRAGRTRSADDRPLFVVATQCIEAGADIDVDALVTQVAPIDCLRQRFGRLDRLGGRGASRAIVIAAADDLDPKRELVYGRRTAEAWKWLEAQADGLDFGVAAMEERLAAAGPAPVAERPDAPVLFPAYLDLWVTTSPPPSADPDPALFLHGPERSGDVAVVWRADVEPLLDQAAGTAEERLRQLADLLAACPPSPLEAVPVPVWSLKRWLAGDTGDGVDADIPTRSVAEDQRAPRSHDVVRLDDDGPELVRADALRAGDRVLLPSSQGGCDRWGWAPASAAVVTDLGMEANQRQRRRAVVRLHPEVLAVTVAMADSDAASDAWRSVRDLLAHLGDASPAEIAREAAALPELPSAWRDLLRHIAGRRRGAWIVAYEPGDMTRGVVLGSSVEVPDAPGLEVEEAGVPAATEEAATLGRTVPIELEPHCMAVEREAGAIATRLGLPDGIVRAIRLAARLHDAGKAEPRFQALLHGGTLAALAEDRLLAKGVGDARAVGLPERDRPPPGFRHEALSVALAMRHPEVTALDPELRELVLWLIGTHHGHGRPFFPPTTPPDGRQIRLSLAGAELAASDSEAPLAIDGGWVELRHALVDRFGHWELARLEAVLRLADHRVSAEEQRRVTGNEA